MDSSAPSLAYYGKKVTGRFQWFVRHGPALKKVSGLVLIGLSVFFIIPMIGHPFLLFQPSSLCT